jgi:hypothetical protein
LNEHLLTAFDHLTSSLAARLARRAAELALARLASSKASRLLDSLVTHATRDEVVVKITGVAALFNDGMGPGGRGTTGPYDMRKFLLRGRRSQSVPVAPGVFRTISLNGKPWIHPGFPRADILGTLRREIRRILWEAHRDR